MTTEWVDWHRQYQPGSALTRRLQLVQDALRAALSDAPPGDIRLVSVCAGDGRDILGVVPGHPRRHDVQALLVELDPMLAGTARERAAAAHLDGVQVRQSDAGVSDAYAGAVPAQIVLLCGVFGNITDADVRTTVKHLPRLCAANAHVIWTRGTFEPDITPQIRRWFVETEFEEIRFERVPDSTAAVGHNVFIGAPQAFPPGVRLFTFLERSQRPSQRAQVWR